MNLRDFVTARIDAMASRPEMYASNRESFGLQLVLLAEILLHELSELPSGISRNSELMRQLYGPGNAVSMLPIDGAWARLSVAITQKFIGEALGPP